jgi:hypothetical protein
MYLATPVSKPQRSLAENPEPPKPHHIERSDVFAQGSLLSRGPVIRFGSAISRDAPNAPDEIGALFAGGGAGAGVREVQRLCLPDDQHMS